MPKRKYQTPEIMHDAPLSDKKASDFHFDDFAATLARLIASPNTETPLAIGINGAWGSGKTSLLLRVKNMLDQPKGENGKGEHRFAHGEEQSFRTCKTVWFDAWKYNDEKELLVALVRVILQAMGRDGFINKAKSWFNDPAQKSYDAIAMFINAFGISFGGLGAEFKFQLDPKKHEQISPFEKYTAFFDHFDDAFTLLLKAWTGKDGILVIFIDDLDRCLPAKTVQTLEAMKLFLDKSGCVFMLGADIKIVQSAVETHYKNAGIVGEGAKDYLEKVIQIRFDLPPIVEAAMADYLKTQNEANDMKVDDAMLKRWQALVAAAEVNPRRVKNVINDLNLQWFMAVNSGQAEGVNRDDFICWQALMRAAPATFVDQVRKFEDKDLRHSFILDAIKWQKGKQEDRDLVKGFFTAYEGDDARRMRRVLKQISFSDDFSSDTLESMIYMSAPPPKPELEKSTLEEPKKVAEPELAGTEVAAEAKVIGMARGVSRGEGAVMPADQNRLTIGGLDFMPIPAGRFEMGSKDDNEFDFENERPRHVIDLAYEYWMGKFILTNRQFSEFIKDTKYETTAEKEGGWHPKQGKFIKGVDWKHPTDKQDKWEDKEDHPVVQVSWDDAMAYCKWFNETFKSELGGLLLRLPTEAEWEKAARGTDAFIYPWGNDAPACDKSNFADCQKLSADNVIAREAGRSPYKLFDMAGNVFEWVQDWYDPEAYTKGISLNEHKVIRGGAFHSTAEDVRTFVRSFDLPTAVREDLGFRCVLENEAVQNAAPMCEMGVVVAPGPQYEDCFYELDVTATYCSNGKPYANVEINTNDGQYIGGFGALPPGECNLGDPAVCTGPELSSFEVKGTKKCVVPDIGITECPVGYEPQNNVCVLVGSNEPGVCPNGFNTDPSSGCCSVVIAPEPMCPPGYGYEAPHCTKYIQSTVQVNLPSCTIKDKPDEEPEPEPLPDPTQPPICIPNPATGGGCP